MELCRFIAELGNPRETKSRKKLFSGTSLRGLSWSCALKNLPRVLKNLWKFASFPWECQDVICGHTLRIFNFLDPLLKIHFGDLITLKSTNKPARHEKNVFAHKLRAFCWCLLIHSVQLSLTSGSIICFSLFKWKRNETIFFGFMSLCLWILGLWLWAPCNESLWNCFGIGQTWEKFLQ